MSSHHIIRDEQEPALLVWDSRVIATDHWLPLMEWSPLVWVHEHSLDHFLDNGLKIDGVLLHSMTENELKDKLAFQWPVKFYQPTELRLENAIRFLIEQNCHAINVLVPSTDLTKLIEELETVCKLVDLVLIHEMGRTLFLKSGKFEKWVEKDRKYWVHQTENIETVNLIQENKAFVSKESGMLKIGHYLAKPLIITELW